jgi:hypothetical protein
MAGELQHCPTCDEEYVAGVATCVECGGPLQPGPLERLEQRARTLTRPGKSVDAAGGAPRPMRLLAEIPGLQADHAVRALLLEGIACRVETQGVGRTYEPDQPPAEPFAVTLPVSIYVSDAQFDAADEVLNSFEPGDVIGDQWSDAGGEDASLAEADASLEPVGDREPTQPSEPLSDSEPSPEGTSLRTVVLIVVVAIVLLFIFGR